MLWWIGTAAALAVALVLQTGLVAYAAYVLLGLMLVSRWLSREGLNLVEADRTFPAGPFEVGDDADVRVTVTNAGKLPLPWLLLEDLLPRFATRSRPPRLAVTGRALKVAGLRAGGATTLKYTLTFAYRGYYQIGPLALESGDLFGLYRRHRTAGKPAFALVLPRVVPLSGYDIASQRPIGEVRLLHRLYEDPTRVAGIRPYQPGDPLQRVHWRATARTGALHSKVYDPSTLAGLSVLLDFHAAGYPKRGEPHRSDLAVTVACSLAHAVAMLNQQVGFASNGHDAADRIRLEEKRREFASRRAARAVAEEADDGDRLAPVVVETRRGVEQFQRIREALARVELTDGLSFPQLVLEMTPRLPRDATALAVLPAVPLETALALGTLKRSGFAVSVVLVGLPEGELEEAFGRLLAEGVRDVRHVGTEAGLGALCQPATPRDAPYQLEVEA